MSLVLPAFNEAENIRSAVAAAVGWLDIRGVDGEVVVVDDGSVDGTAEIARGRDDRVRVLRHEVNRGYGAALRTGILAARCEHIFFTDADLQFDLAEIGLLEPWIASFDIVVGYRRQRSDNLVRRLNARGWNWMMDALFDVGVRDVDCAFKVFHRRVFDRVPIRSVGAFVNSEILVRARAAGFQMKEVAVSHYPRRAGVQTGAAPEVILRAIKELSGLYQDLRTEQRRSADPRR